MKTYSEGLTIHDSIEYIFSVEKSNLCYLIDSLKDFLSDARFSSSVTQVADLNNKINLMATVGITGDKVGFLTLSMNLDNAVNLAEFFANLMKIPLELKEFGTPHIEVLSELSNQIAGRVVMFMEMNDTNCSITPPTVLSGGDISIDLKSLKQTQLFKVEGSFGFFHITIGLK